MDELIDRKDQEKYKGNRLPLRALTLAVVLSYGVAIFGLAESLSTLKYFGATAGVIGLIALFSGLTLKERLVFFMGSMASVSTLAFFLMMYFLCGGLHDAQYLMFIFGVMCLLVLVVLAIWFFTSRSSYGRTPR